MGPGERVGADEEAQCHPLGRTCVRPRLAPIEPAEARRFAGLHGYLLENIIVFRNLTTNRIKIFCQRMAAGSPPTASGKLTMRRYG
jgi:hypothetical protein